ncbi:hypothetical protein [Pseudoxanthomonas mexicana]
MSVRKPFLVKAASVEDAIAELPSLEEWGGSFDEEVDLFIVSRGFEKRVCAFPDDLVQRGIKVRGPILLGHYRTNGQDNDLRAEELMPLLDAIATQPHLQCDADTPSAVRDAIRAVLDKVPDLAPCHVVFDISASSSTFILSALLTIFSIDRPIRLTVLYATAAVYHTPREDDIGRPAMQWAESNQREQGVSDVGTNELQAGIHHDHLPGFAIATPSMFGTRLQRCLGHLGLDSLNTEEQEIYWLLPDTDSEDHKWRHDAIMRTVLAIMCSDDETPASLPVGSFGHCGALDYKECARLVMREIERRTGANVSMIHMGTKLQAIGVALALSARPEVSLVHARPEAFTAKSYSDGVGTLRRIVFADVRGNVRYLARVGTLQIEAC